MSLFKAILNTLNIYVSYKKYKHRRYIYDLEDEIDRLAADGSPAAKLRLERLSGRLHLERKRLI